MPLRTVSAALASTGAWSRTRDHADVQCMDFFRAYRECKGKWVSLRPDNPPVLGSATGGSSIFPVARATTRRHLTDRSSRDAKISAPGAILSDTRTKS